MRLSGKKAIVTGGAGAIGSGICLRLAREGADVAIGYLTSESKADRLVKEIKSMGRDTIAIKVNMKEVDEIQKAIDETVKAFGRLDIVINCFTTGIHIPFLDLTLDDINGMIDLNIKGYFMASLFGARQMVKQGGPGWIVNIGSISSRGMTSTMVHYGATKGAIESLTRGMAVALGRKNIRVNCVTPGAVMTPTVANMFEEPKNADPINSRTPLGRIVTIEECVGPTIFFCSEESSGITGQTLDVDGGYMVQGMEWNLTEDMMNFRKKLESQGNK